MRFIILLLALNTPLLSMAGESAVDHDGRSGLSKYEAAGLGASALAGAVLGGPPGLILGLGAGAFLGEHGRAQKALGAARKRLAELGKALTNAVGERELLAQNTQRLIARGAELESGKARDLEAISNGVLLSVHFRTGSFTLEPHFSMRLSELGRALAVMSSLHVRLDGYADIRGSRRFNRKLSQRRAQAVRGELAKFGVSEERIQWAAHGESESLYPSRDRDGYAFDRRVDIRLSLPGAAS
ncbi:MAG: hypothetical protein DRQ37_05375 [Gammaproteobacteria bacterium]|nr:MAG: hypothetical protein DRQ37_05375 [Gammaproteobacteria bacterium]